MDMLKWNNVSLCLSSLHIKTRRTLGGVAGVSRQVCTQTPADVLSTGMHKRVQRWLCSHTEDLADAARAGCVYIDKTCI